MYRFVLIICILSYNVCNVYLNFLYCLKYISFFTYIIQYQVYTNNQDWKCPSTNPEKSTPRLGGRFWMKLSTKWLENCRVGFSLSLSLFSVKSCAVHWPFKYLEATTKQQTSWYFWGRLTGKKEEEEEEEG